MYPKDKEDPTWNPSEKEFSEEASKIDSKEKQESLGANMPEGVIINIYSVSKAISHNPRVAKLRKISL